MAIENSLFVIKKSQKKFNIFTVKNVGCLSYVYIFRNDRRDQRRIGSGRIQIDRGNERDRDFRNPRDTDRGLDRDFRNHRDGERVIERDFRNNRDAERGHERERDFRGPRDRFERDDRDRDRRFDRDRLFRSRGGDDVSYIYGIKMNKIIELIFKYFLIHRF